MNRSNTDRTTTGGRPYNPETHRRRSIRLKDYDYSQAGAYFVTICTQERACLFGEVVDGEMRLSEAGWMVHAIFEELSVFYSGVDTDAFAILPNHIHGVIVLRGTDVVGATPCGRPDAGQAQGPAPTRLSLPDVVHRFKTLTTKRYADAVKDCGWPPFAGRIWQHNYYEHIIRNEASLNRIRQYIVDNPARWAFDRENPDAVTPELEDRWRT